MSHVGKVSGGVQISPEVEKAYDMIKMKRNVSHRYAIFKLSDDMSTVVIEHEGGIDEGLPTAAERKKATYEKVIKLLPDGDCRFCVYDNDTTMAFLMWTPLGASVKNRMVYSSTKDVLKKKLPGCERFSFEFHERSDIKEKMCANN